MTGTQAGAGDQKPPAQTTPPATPPTGQGEPPKEGDAQHVPYSRFSEVNTKLKETQAQLDQLRKAQEEDARKKAEENGEHKKLYEAEKAAREATEQRYTQLARNNAVSAAAAKAGCVDPTALVKLLSLETLQVKDGEVDSTAVTAMVENAKASYAYMFGTKQQAQGSSGGTPAGGSGDKPTFKRSQIRDREFYLKNEPAIKEAMREGRIIEG